MSRAPWKVPLRKAMTSGRPEAAAGGAIKATRQPEVRMITQATAAKMRTVSPKLRLVLRVAVHAVVALNGPSASGHLSKIR